MKCRVRAIIRDQSNCLLLVKHVGHTAWNLPGGGIEDGEGLRQALVRELLEELGIRAKVGRLAAVHQFRQGGTYEGPEFFFVIDNPEDFLNINIAQTSHGGAEIAELRFFDPGSTEGLRPAFLADETFQDGIVVVLEP